MPDYDVWRSGEAGTADAMFEVRKRAEVRELRATGTSVLSLDHISSGRHAGSTLLFVIESYNAQVSEKDRHIHPRASVLKLTGPDRHLPPCRTRIA